MRGLAAAIEIRHGGTFVVFCFWGAGPCGRRRCGGQPGSCGPALQQTPVGDDARTAPAGAFRRPKTTGPALRPEIVPGALRRRECPRADMESAPTNKILCFGPTGWRWHLCRFVGEGHGPPVDVRGTARPRGRGMPLPYKPSEHDPRNRTTATHPGVRRAGCPHPAGPRGRARFPGRDKSRPYE